MPVRTDDDSLGGVAFGGVNDGVCNMTPISIFLYRMSREPRLVQLLSGVVGGHNGHVVQRDCGGTGVSLWANVIDDHLAVMDRGWNLNFVQNAFGGFRSIYRDKDLLVGRWRPEYPPPLTRFL
jgi:hypothetical protein